MGIKLKHILVATLLVFLDQIIKTWAQHTLEFQSIVIINPILRFDLVHNYGAAYGIFQGQRFFLLAVGFLVFACACFLHKFFAKSAWSQWGLAILLSGTLGNLIDRTLLGYVIDYMNIHIIPVFNLADVCINHGTGLFIIEIVLNNRKKENKTLKNSSK